jgi:hypothetical protein|tara:strand:- start:911 stop:1255 length:345 start_codon:yes stop_codon:yes gene_type:complete
MLTTANRSGFEPTANALWISKDVEAQLIYTFNWTNWLEDADTISTVVYTVAARRNDPTPIVIADSGKTSGNTKTYVELSGGQLDKAYIVSCKVTTGNGLVDSRNFRVQVEARSA